MTIKTTFLGTLATNKYHSCILVEEGETRILIEPTQEVENIDAVFILDIDRDEYSKYQFYVDKNIPIYSIGAIKEYAEDVELRKHIKLITKNFKINNLRINVIKCPVSPHHPQIGIKFPKHNLCVIPELSFYLSQQLIKDISLPASHLICGVGNFAKDDKKKITFKNFLTSIERTKKHKGLLSISLTNFRKDLITHKNEVLKTLKDNWNIPTYWASEDMTLQYDKKLVKELKEIKEKRNKKSQHSRSSCMECKSPPQYEILWAEGMALVWFCEKHAKQFVKKHYKECLEDGYSYNCDLNSIKRIEGEASEYFKDNKNPNILSRFIREARESLHLTGEVKKTKELKADYLSLSKPGYRMDFELLESDLKRLGWDKKNILVSSKIDGLRVTVLKVDNKATILVDPEGLKRKSPNISHRLIALIKEIEENFPNNTIADAELFAMDGTEGLHRTIMNSIVNSKMDAEKLTPFSYLYVFDIMYYEGKNLMELSLLERLKYLQKVKDSKHIFIEHPTLKTEAGHSAYIIKAGRIADIKKVWDFIINNKGLRKDNKYVTHLAEGVVLKQTDGKYILGNNKTWTKIKIFREIDTVILTKDKVKGTTRTFNYLTGLDISEEYAKALASMKTKDWYDTAGVLMDNKLYRGKEVLDKKKGRYVLVMSKTNNSNIQGDVGEILRVSAEEIIRYDNEEHPEYPRYSFYVGRCVELVPERKISDDLTVLYRLSLLEPKRMSIEDLSHIEGKRIPRELKKFIEHARLLSLDKLKELYKSLNNNI
ncbi:MAG: ATP-dependent DNA ligase [Halanaerobiales bacterium]|nr:ATP-dependent DNA ligase [Halanaerobiales bacterium]